MAKIKEKKIVKGKFVCTDDTKSKIVRVVCKNQLPDSELDRYIKKGKK